MLNLGPGLTRSLLEPAIRELIRSSDSSEQGSIEAGRKALNKGEYDSYSEPGCTFLP